MTKIHGSVTVQRDFIGRDQINQTIYQLQQHAREIEDDKKHYGEEYYESFEEGFHSSR